jgi:hypothetical protein
MVAPVLLAALGLLLTPTPLAPAVAPAVAPVRVHGISMAHHVKDKAAKKHNANRPRKSRLSDINRTPPSYPTLPEPRGPIVGPPMGQDSVTVSITVVPGDDVAAVKAKLTAAGASAPDTLMFRGQPVTGTLGDCGLAAEESISVIIM